jgi:integrase
MHMVLHACLLQAVKERLIPRNPCDNCKIPKLEKKEMSVLPQEKIGTYLAEAEKYGLLALFYLELTSGLRRGELLALQWSDIDTENKTASVSKQVYRINGALVVTTPKTKNSIRKVAIPHQALELLIAEHERHPDNPLIFPSPVNGGPYSPETIGRIHKKLLKRAEISENVRFHDLRHTFATLALQNGVDVKTLSSILGHYSAGFTLDTYTHVTTKMQREAADKVAGFLDGATA